MKKTHTDTAATNGRGLDRRTFIELTGALLGSTVLGGVPHAAHALDKALPNTIDGAVKGGTLDALIHPEPPTLASFINTSTPGRAVFSKIFDGLLDYGPDLAPRPQLAESWETSKDGLVWTLHLRKNVFWHDGTPFTSADVKFSADVIWKKYAPTARRVLRHLASAEAPDEHTIVLTLTQSTPVLINALDAVAAPVLPKHLYEGTDVPNNPHNNAPIGTGPFVFKEWVRGSHIALERFDKYWQPGRPFLNKLTWKIITDVAGRANALETGVVQYGERNPVTFADADRFKTSDKLIVSTEGYNGFSGTLWLIPNWRDPILSNFKVRAAILHAIDRQLLTKTVWGGYAVPATGPVSSLLKPFYEPAIPQYAFDKKKAEALLDEAGFPKKADGWRFKLTHDFIPFGDDYRRTGEFVRQALRAVGIDVELRSLDLATWTKNVFTDYNFQLVSSWGINWQDPQLGIEQHFWSKAESKGTPWFNASGYASQEVDALFEDAQGQTDADKRIADYKQVQKIVQRDLARLDLFEFRWFGVWDKRLRNVTDTFDHSQNNFAHVWWDQTA